MKDNLKILLLHHYLNKNLNLFQVILILISVGSLLILVLPIIFNQEISTEESEARNYIGTINRYQQAYILESAKFAKRLDYMCIAGQKRENQNYKYYLETRKNATFSYGISLHDYIQVNLVQIKPIHSYIGAVFAVSNGKESDLTSIAIICKNEQPGSIVPAEPTYKNGVIQCAPGTTKVSR